MSTNDAGWPKHCHHIFSSNNNPTLTERMSSRRESEFVHLEQYFETQISACRKRKRGQNWNEDLQRTSSEIDKGGTATPSSEYPCPTSALRPLGPVGGHTSTLHDTKSANTFILVNSRGRIFNNM